MEKAALFSNETQLESLIARCALSDRQALSQLYLVSAPKLYGIGLRILQDNALVEDAMQEAYFKIWEKASTYQRELGQPLTWMNIIMRRQCIDLLRRQKSRVTSSNESVCPDTLASDQDGPYIRTVRSESRELLAVCMARLEKRQQDVISELYVQGSTQEEVANRLKIPVGTVKTWCRRCMQKLRECIQQLTDKDIQS